MELPILREIVIILSLSIAIILLFRTLKLPSILGFIIAGMLIGPHGFFLVGVSHEVEIMAELGVIFLLFIIGIEFSLSTLANIKRTVVVGGGLQVFLTAAVSMIAARVFGIPWNQSVFIGFLFALSSTAIVLKQLQENGEINTPHGRVTVAILIFQDIIVVPMMLFTPLLAGNVEVETGNIFLILLLKVFLVIGIVILMTRYIVPWLLHHVTKTKSQELFVITIVVICLATAWLTSSIGLSLALGAFFAGLIISESEYSYQAVGNILPLRELFISFFFVSIGMLLDFRFTFANIHIIAPLAIGVIIVKFFIANFSVLILGYPLRTSFLAANSVFQVGEFAFLLSIVGISTGILSHNHYQYFLSISLITMAITPFAIKNGENLFDNVFFPLIPSRFKKMVVRLSRNNNNSLTESLNDHLVIIGYGINGINVGIAAEGTGIPYVVLELDPEKVRSARNNNVPVVYGDAGERFILEHVHIENARVVVIAVNDPSAIQRILKVIRSITETAYIIVRTRHIREIEDTINNGANEVIPEEFETSIEIFARVMRHYLINDSKINEYINKVRDSNYEMLRPTMPDDKKIPVFNMNIPNMEIFTVSISNCEMLMNKDIGDLDLRKNYGITVIAIKRDDDYITVIGPDTIFRKEDTIYLIGTHEDVVKFNNAIKCNIGKQ